LAGVKRVWLSLFLSIISYGINPLHTKVVVDIPHRPTPLITHHPSHNPPPPLHLVVAPPRNQLSFSGRVHPHEQVSPLRTWTPSQATVGHLAYKLFELLTGATGIVLACTTVNAQDVQEASKEKIKTYHGDVMGVGLS
jgi:hypothetical protein